MKKIVLIFGFAFATVAAVLTIIVVATATSESFPFSFDFGMYVATPVLIVARIFGITHMNPWLAGSLATLLNTTLCFLAGGLAGFTCYHLSTNFSKKH